MPLIIKELKDSRGGDGKEQTFRYSVERTIDDLAVRAAIEDYSPTTYAGKARKDDEIELDHRGGGVWIVEVPYEVPDAEWPEPEDGSETIYAPSLSFDSTGGTHHIDHSIKTAGTYMESMMYDAPDFGGLVGVNDGEVAGCDVVIPKLELPERHYFLPTELTYGYIKTVTELTGTVNSDVFRVWQPGEVLFMGARGNRDKPELWIVEFLFAISRNAQNLHVGDIIVDEKKGWHHLWVHNKEVVDETAKQIVKKPLAVYVEQVYPEKAFSTLNLPAPAVGR